MDARKLTIEERPGEKRTHVEESDEALGEIDRIVRPKSDGRAESDDTPGVDGSCW